MWDIGNYGEVLLICEKWLRHLYNGFFIIGTVKMVGKHGLNSLLGDEKEGIFTLCTVLNAAFR